jgi:nucleoid-associated protein YgaU
VPSHEDVLTAAAEKVGIEDFRVTHANGRWLVNGRVEYQLDREQFLDAIKDIDGWERNIVVQIEVANREVRGFYVVQPGETLADIAERYLGRPDRQWDIVEANRDRMNDPAQILPGQELLLPRR